ncbi:MAG: uroporphyrinogen decarboxylase [Desulfobacterales bacterium C00003104]|nr:MAG: uroporphyrinogen decarboxylase [Desulfobacterales bacterium C00003104]
MTDYRFIRACFRQEVDRTPVWIMRQAGRYMPEYRAIRKKVDFLELCKTPELAAKVTIQPVDRLNVDAAILFSDILTLPEAMGIDLRFGEGMGPKLSPVIRSRSDIDKLKEIDPETSLSFVMETIRILRRELDGRVPLIGFSGSPFTLATYLVEGGSSKDFINLKSMMYREPDTAHALFEKLADAIAVYLNAQIEAGAQAVQLFDTWAGICSPSDFDSFVFPYVKNVVDRLRRDGVPVIYYCKGGSTLLDRMRNLNTDVIGVDWRIEIDDAWKAIGHDRAIQGNLDPCVLFMDQAGIKERVRDILERAGGRPGHIFNLGHGVLPATPVENVQALVEMVHDLSEQRA